MLCGVGFVVFGVGYVVFGDGYVVIGDGYVACRDVQLHVSTCNPLSRPQPVIPIATHNPATIHNPVRKIKPFDINQNLCLPTL
jgi:hypothetical protein